MRNGGRIQAVVCVVALAGAARALANEPPGGELPVDREQQLWERIMPLTQPVAATQPYEDWFEAARRQRQVLLTRLRLYLTVYPGGAHRDEALRLELVTLFELATLRDGALDELCARVEELLRAPPSADVGEEAAYWAILCRHRAARSATSRPTSAPVGTPDPTLLSLYREYFQTYPRSRYAPRLADLLFADAARRDDRAALQDVLTQMRTHFADHAVTAALEGQWRRITAVGESFWPALRTLDGREVHRSDYEGHPTLIIVWAGFDDRACRSVQEVNHLRSTHAELRVIGVALDETAAQTATAARELGLDWPQCNDELGWGGEFVRNWGVAHVPFVFILDRAGRLVGTATEADWAELARPALEPSPN